jgi:hypothetical protein
MPRRKSKIDTRNIETRNIFVDYSINPNYATKSPHPPIPEDELKNFELITGE